MQRAAHRTSTTISGRLWRARCGDRERCDGALAGRAFAIGDDDDDDAPVRRAFAIGGPIGRTFASGRCGCLDRRSCTLLGILHTCCTRLMESYAKCIHNAMSVRLESSSLSSWGAQAVAPAKGHQCAIIEPMSHELRYLFIGARWYTLEMCGNGVYKYTVRDRKARERDIFGGEV